MRVLCTFPGRYGDLLWALPAVRALSRRLGKPLDLAVSMKYSGLCALIEQQPYISRCPPLASWQVEETAPISPRVPLVNEAPGYDLRLHLGYRGWPQRPLPFETLDCLNAQSEISGSKWTRFGGIPDTELVLTEPWITLPPVDATTRCALAVAFTDEHFELKFGTTLLVLEQFVRSVPDMTYQVLTTPNSRWDQESWPWHALRRTAWQGYAETLSAADVLLTDCSAAHVLAVALGVPTVLMEPQEARWNDIFYPLGKAGPAVTLVMGHDGRPTFDARAVREAVEAVLSRRGVLR